MKKNLSLVMGVLLILSWYVTLSTWLGNEEKYQGFIEEAKRLESKGLYLDAITEYEEAKEIKADSLEVDTYIADAYYAMGDYKSYRKQLNSIIDKHGPVEEIVTKLYDYYVAYHSQNTLIDEINELYSEYPDSKIIQTYYNSLKGVYDELYVAVSYIDNFTGGRAVYELNGKKGIMDTDGDIVIEPVYDDLKYNGKNDDKIIVCDNGSYLTINMDGYKTGEPENDYDYLGVLSQKRVVAIKDNKYGYLNSSLEEKIPLEYDGATAFSNGVAAVKKGNKWALIDTKGEAVTEYLYDDIAINSNEVCSANELVCVKQGDKWSLINIEGEPIGTDSYDAMKAFEGNGYCAVCKGNSWGYINSEGTLIIDYQYEDAKSFANGYAPVMKEGLWGYIDSNNLLMIDYTFGDANHMTEKGLAPVSLDNMWTLIELKILN